jgi:hypothetical protein
MSKLEDIWDKCSPDDECSHIAVKPEVVGLIMNLEAVAYNSCAAHAGVIKQALCLLRRTFAAEPLPKPAPGKPLPEELRDLVA